MVTEPGVSWLHKPFQQQQGLSLTPSRVFLIGRICRGHRDEARGAVSSLCPPLGCFGAWKRCRRWAVEDAELPSSTRQRAVGGESRAELMVIKPNPSLLASSPPAEQEEKLVFLQFHLLQAEGLLYRAGSPVLQLVRAQSCLNCLFDNCSGCKNRGFCGEFTQGCLQLPPSFILQYCSLPSRRYS